MLLRRIIPVLAILLCGLWLLVAYGDVVVPDRYGYNTLAAILEMEALILLYAIICTVFSANRLLPWPLTLSLLSITPLHLWGAKVNAPDCHVIFLAPLVAVLITGIWSFVTACNHRASI